MGFFYSYFEKFPFLHPLKTFEEIFGILRRIV